MASEARKISSGIPNIGVADRRGYANHRRLQQRKVKDIGPGPIVVGVDFSAGSHSAVQYAVAMEPRWRRELRFVHVIEAEKALGGGLDPGALEAVGEQLREFAGNGGAGAVRHVVLIGKAEVQLLRYAQEARAGCLILGAAGWGQREMDCGSVCRACLLEDRFAVRVVRAGWTGPCEIRGQ